MAAAATAVPVVAATVTLESLLSELTDRDANTYFPEPAYTSRLWSSYDRETVDEGGPGWFANGDCNKFLRTDTVDGRTEDVLVDAKGPGAIVRFWITTSERTHDGDIRIYIDGKQAIEGNCLDLVGGGLLAGTPLSDYLPKEAPHDDVGNRETRGQNLYLPIPYAKNCKVVFRRKPGTGGAFFYNIETRTYPQGTKVESFSKQVLARAKKAVERANRELASGIPSRAPVCDETVSFSGPVPVDGSTTRTIRRAKGGAVRRLSMNVTGWDENLLRSTVLEMSFDGERTVWVPVGDFFGCGPVYESRTGWFSSTPGTGILESRWTMPFEHECTITVHNFGRGPIMLGNAAAEIGPYAWDSSRSMHFGSAWHLYADVDSRAGDDRSPWDYDYAELEGRGVFVGTTLSLWQECCDWWGEGDEKVFVDGEKRPSFIGTGTEDHYGYAWGDSRPFSHPFLGQPIGIGQGRAVRLDTFRRSMVNVRDRALDAIPFTKSIRYLMEMWHWRDCKIDFAPTARFYMRPGGKCNRGIDVEAARRPARCDVSMFRNYDVPATATLFADFEGADYEGWIASGDCFGKSPARGTLANQNPVFGYNGRGLVNTFLDGDDTTGTLTSPEFTIEKAFVNFLCGGGNYKGETCVNLIVDGKVVRTAEGTGNEQLAWRSWDVKDLNGKIAKIQIVDERKGHFGHINVDMIMFDDNRRDR